jgi:hypothetical protein
MAAASSTEFPPKDVVEAWQMIAEPPAKKPRVVEAVDDDDFPPTQVVEPAEEPAEEPKQPVEEPAEEPAKDDEAFSGRGGREGKSG